MYTNWALVASFSICVDIAFETTEVYEIQAFILSLQKDLLMCCTPKRLQLLMEFSAKCFNE